MNQTISDFESTEKRGFDHGPGRLSRSWAMRGLQDAQPLLGEHHGMVRRSSESSFFFVFHRIFIIFIHILA